mmetsp:Transcript_3730/g.6361  ORF Transcript_3730/g.6361 Transcript_3730/m.6361 type:complete len:127 (+) Transcript_3730:55-435(+)|eukprot:CAMPEP_0168625132 /NCGR_PEP_ID=MMETSP0449_2-20121227/9831_1 /TAXON_ID=1082188 /ORGANISM="Strombidium rassoulzadegani, Strain ras09" /LENGTH=126 /DNA_ID=CAMNT_0008666831 /DNA_START=41 /DNA_END=421 /DNA_ORIENTATION=-
MQEPQLLWLSQNPALLSNLDEYKSPFEEELFSSDNDYLEDFNKVSLFMPCYSNLKKADSHGSVKQFLLKLPDEVNFEGCTMEDKIKFYLRVQKEMESRLKKNEKAKGPLDTIDDMERFKVVYDKNK